MNKLFEQFEQILEAQELPAYQDKSAVVLVGRFNPPHAGHTKAMREAKTEFRKGNHDKVIVVVVEGKNTSEDKRRNPLSGESRVKYLLNSSYGKGVDYIIAENAYAGLVKVRQEGYEPMVVVGGKLNDDNTAEKYKGILDKYFKNGSTEINHKAVSLERDPETDGIEGISGTVVRAAILVDDFDSFKEWTCIESEEILKQMFDECKSSMHSYNMDEE